ncbi:hydrogenase formation protein HypD [Halothermothrix orenii]|uniref:Hydrogenase formation HypD protein n=1 Tax=Halothermothrix orenii (strain H 168 / OCM 544 / DSM 9562) TaxID=373903 RepID=B8D1S3_HALOH|nr:hydrogenase formation protein HypD [Halothermothrix orenii]ACL69150.1 hydrogenase formation HypD protein [Halothermothrix orenii H 168]
MKCVDELSDRKIISGIVSKIKAIKLSGKVKIMEVCGTHTMSIFKNGIKSLLPDSIELISGPGCPVCVTPDIYIDKALALAKKENVIITTFADLLRVPGSSGTLQEMRVNRKNITTVYSPLEAVKIAYNNPGQEVIFLAIGFETTIPAIALSIIKANQLGLNNFSILQSLKIMPPVLQELVLDKDLDVDGFILPGHVSTISGLQPFEFLARDYHVPGVVAGFEPGDIILSIYTLCKMLKDNDIRVKNLYPRLVRLEGNKKAQELIKEIFTPVDSYWRGLGTITGSGLKLRKVYHRYSAEKKFQFGDTQYRPGKGCICGEILKGKQKPTDCRLFGIKCTPMKPEGPCMVSREGTCAAYYRYRGKVNL